MNQLYRSHSPNGIRLITIYIAEAHASDQWPAGKTISCFRQPKSLDERLNNARYFQKTYEFEMPILVDSMENRFHLTYGSWPFRFYVVHQGKLVLKPEPGEQTYAYDMDELDRWISEFYLQRTN